MELCPKAACPKVAPFPPAGLADATPEAPWPPKTPGLPAGGLLVGAVNDPNKPAGVPDVLGTVPARLPKMPNAPPILVPLPGAPGAPDVLV